MAGRVLVTRPQPGASSTARRLRQLGFEPVVLPLISTVPLQPAAPAGALDAIAVTSAAALHHASQRLLAPWLDLRCFCVGEATAAAARAAGFVDVRSGGGDAGALGETIVAGLPAGSTIGFLCGRLRMATLERMLWDAQLQVTPIETYDTTTTRFGPRDLPSVLEGSMIDAVLFHSASAAEAAKELLADERFRAALERSAVLCISARVAKAVDARFAGQRLVAAHPDEDNLLALLIDGQPGRALS